MTKPKNEGAKPAEAKAPETQPESPKAPSGEDLAIELELVREENAKLQDELADLQDELAKERAQTAAHVEKITKGSAKELRDLRQENAALKAELEEQAAASGLAAYRGQTIEPGAFLVQRKIRYVPRGGAEVVIAEPGEVVRNLTDKDAERFHRAGVTIPHVKIGG